MRGNYIGFPSGQGSGRNGGALERLRAGGSRLYTDAAEAVEQAEGLELERK